jgi:hypothetical protein
MFPIRMDCEFCSSIDCESWTLLHVANAFALRLFAPGTSLIP